MQTVLDWHRAIGWYVIFSNALVGCWCFVAYRWEAARSRLLWWAVGAAQLGSFAIAILGVVLVNRYHVELDQFHALYGFSAIVAIAILYSYRTSPFMRGKEHLLYGFGSLFIMGLGIRSMVL